MERQDNDKSTPSLRELMRDFGDEIGRAVRAGLADGLAELRRAREARSAAITVQPDAKPEEIADLSRVVRRARKKATQA